MFRNIVSAALLLASMGAVGSIGNSALAGITSQATGKGALVFDDGFTVSFQFKAGEDELGKVYGEIQFWVKTPGGEENFGVHGTVTCYTLISDTTAIFAGIVDSSTDPELVGTFFFAKVVDGDPDEFRVFGTDDELVCEDIDEDTDPIDRGSIQVHVKKE